MTLLRVTAPPVTAISLDEAKAHLRVDSTDEDTLITSLIAAAEQSIGPDSEYGIALAEQQWKLLRDDFPACGDAIELRVSQVTAIDSITYVDRDGATQTVSSSDYKLKRGGRLASFVYPAYGKFWPAARCQPESVQITFTCGYEPSSGSPTNYVENIPAPLKHALKLLVADMFANREPVNIGSAVNRLPTLNNLLDPYKVF